MFNLDLVKITGIAADNTIAADSVNSAQKYIGVYPTTPGYWFWKPNNGDVAVLCTIEGKHFLLAIVPSISSAALTATLPGNLRIPTGHHLDSEDDQTFNGQNTPFH